jgi:hypothetical protein
MRERDDQRLLDADGEILRASADLQQLAGQPVTIATGDTAMKLRARAWAVKVLAVPDDFQQPLALEGDQSSS